MKNKPATHYLLPTTYWRLSHAGLTLIELLVGFAVAGFIILLVASLYMAHSRLFNNQNAAIEVAVQNKIALEEITNQVRESQGVTASCCNPPGETTGANVLVLQIWPLDASGNPFDPGTNYDYIVYKVDPADNTVLIKKIVPNAGSTRQASEKKIATKIATLNFTYDNAPPQTSEVTISLTTSDIYLSRTHTITNSSKAVLRNK